jgi:cytochrome c oxidase subunit 2
MGLRRLDPEGFARIVLALIVVLLPMALVAAWWVAHRPTSAVTVHAEMSEQGGWLPGTIYAGVGSALRLRLISDDVTHGFAIGRSDAAPIDLPPGEIVETTLTFDQPGTYTYYCTRWCGPNHWRMRGVIEVSGDSPAVPAADEPLYMTLAIDIDSPHPASTVPDTSPSARRGQALGVVLPDGFRTRQDFVRRPPADTWLALRRHPSTAALSDTQVWDLVAYFWRSTTTDEALQEGETLFSQNCAACHGENGNGDGSVVDSLPPAASMASGETSPPVPADFTHPSTMLGASSALLQGKILRGGMGTGMPYWGPILTEAQTWAVVDYLWTFQFGEN